MKVTGIKAGLYLLVLLIVGSIAAGLGRGIGRDIMNARVQTPPDQQPIDVASAEPFTRQQKGTLTHRILTMVSEAQTQYVITPSHTRSIYNPFLESHMSVSLEDYALLTTRDSVTMTSSFVTFHANFPADSFDEGGAVTLCFGDGVWEIRVSETTAGRDYQLFLAETVPHHVAHVLRCKMEPARFDAHDDRWMELMNRFRGTPAGAR